MMHDRSQKHLDTNQEILQTRGNVLLCPVVMTWDKSILDQKRYKYGLPKIRQY